MKPKLKLVKPKKEEDEVINPTLSEIHKYLDGRKILLVSYTSGEENDKEIYHLRLHLDDGNLLLVEPEISKTKHSFKFYHCKDISLDFYRMLGNPDDS